MTRSIVRLAVVTMLTVIACLAALSAYAAHSVEHGSWRFLDPYDLGD